jgi:hypothetical protein
VILTLWVLFSSTVFLPSTVFSQDTTSVKCFTVPQQREILKKFVELDECRELRKADSTHIAKLDTALIRSFKVSEVLYKKIDEQHHTIDNLDKKVRNRNKVIVVNILLLSLFIII